MPRRGVDLSEEQWRIVKSHAAKRGQTISTFFGDVIMDLGLGRAQMKPGGPVRDYPPAATHVPVSTSIDSRHTDAIRPGEPTRAAVVPPPDGLDNTGTVRDPDPSFGVSRPAPKPARKK